MYSAVQMGGFMVWETCAILRLLVVFWIFRSLNQWSRRRCKQALKEGHSLPYSLPHLFLWPLPLFSTWVRGVPKDISSALQPPRPAASSPQASWSSSDFPSFPDPAIWESAVLWGWPWPMSPVTSIGRTWRWAENDVGRAEVSVQVNVSCECQWLLPLRHPVPASLKRGCEGQSQERGGCMCCSTAAPSQLFPDSHELILWGKSWGLVKARGMERDFSAPAQVLLPEALNTSYIHSLRSLVFLHVHSSAGLLPYFLVFKRNSPCTFLFRLTA